MSVYADYASGMPVLPCARDSYLSALRCGNPSSTHIEGVKAHKSLEWCRRQILKYFDVLTKFGGTTHDLIFTSGGSESNTQAIKTGVEYCKQNGKKHIVSTAIEHKSVLNVLKASENEGIEVTYLYPNARGEIEPWVFEKFIRDDTGFVTAMRVNNEVGSVIDIGAVADYCHERGIVVHTDAVQSVGKEDVAKYASKVDMLSFSGHKFGSVPGVGGLLYRRGIDVVPLIYGGGQENGKRGGTENVPAICSMEEAFGEYGDMTLGGKLNQVADLRESLKEKIECLTPFYHESPNGIPHIINVAFAGVIGSVLASFLDANGISISTGSACNSGNDEPSHVLKAMGISDQEASSTIRLSLSHTMSQSGIDEIAEKLIECVKYIRTRE